MVSVVGVRFQGGCCIYNFGIGHFMLNVGDMVIVDIEHKLTLGQIVQGPYLLSERILLKNEVISDNSVILVAREPAIINFFNKDNMMNDKIRESSKIILKTIYRLATSKDLAVVQSNVCLEAKAYAYCQERITARKLEMNLVKVKSLFDRSKVIFYFTAEGRLDFRSLVKELVPRFRTRIELRQIGVRHEAKLLRGVGSCGREFCCAGFLKKFASVSVKMAKEQNLSLNSTKISGLCGRLMCCLTYEYKTYQSLKINLSKFGKKNVFGSKLDNKIIGQKKNIRLSLLFAKYFCNVYVF